MIKNIIGQKEAVKQLNNLLEAAQAASKRGEKFYYPPVKFGGLSGLGKSFLAEILAEHSGKPFIECPTKAGIRWFNQQAEHVTSLDEETGESSPIPACVFVDEAHAQPTLRDFFKVLIGKEIHIMRRNGTVWHSDLSEHLWIFASNEVMDKALERRCEVKIELQPYSKAEKRDLLEYYLKKSFPSLELTESGIAFLETRCKPTADDCKTVAKNASLHIANETVLTDAASKKLVGTLGRFHLGLERKEIKALERLKGSPANVSTLKYVMGATGQSAEKEVKDRVGWLASFGLVSHQTQTTFALTKEGEGYLKKLSADIEKMKAERQSLSKGDADKKAVTA